MYIPSGKLKAEKVFKSNGKGYIYSTHVLQNAGGILPPAIFLSVSKV